MKVAIIHDWLTTWAGAEKALADILACYPEAELFTLVNFLDVQKIPSLAGRTIHVSFIQKLPGVRRHYRRYLPLMPLAVEQFNLKGFDLVISSSHAVAKGVMTDPDACHVCYCYSPMRYAWDMQHQYLRQSGHARGLTSVIMRWQLHRLRQWDYLSAQRVDRFIAISHYIQRRIHKCYRRESDVLYPPVAVERFRHDRPREDFYLTASRMVPYKRLDLVVKAFNCMPEKRLVVIGDGPDYRDLAVLAGPNVTMLGYQPDAVLVNYLERARAFVFLAEEDFGILPVEAQAAGAPVIGYCVGGTAETVVHGETGLLVKEQSIEAVSSGVAWLNTWLNAGEISSKACRDRAEQFSRAAFRQGLIKAMEQGDPG